MALSAETGIVWELEKASPVMVVIELALNRSYASVKKPVPATTTARMWEKPTGASSLVAKAALRSALLSPSGASEGVRVLE